MSTTPTTSNPAPCPTCGRPAVGRAFAASPDYARCSLGHVFALASDQVMAKPQDCR